MKATCYFLTINHDDKAKISLEKLDINLDAIQDEKTKETIHALFNLIENQATNIRNLQE